MRNLLKAALPLALALSFHTPAANADTSPQLTIWVFPHDELADISDEQLQTDYFDFWLSEVRQIADMPVLIYFERNIPELTSIDYSGSAPEQTLAVWADASSVWRRRQNNPGSTINNKYLLLTREGLGKEGTATISGIAHQAGHAAIASLASYATPGHELGHTLSATHEQSYINFNGWFCEPYMFAQRLYLRSNCYRYTDENRNNIANYLKKLQR